MNKPRIHKSTASHYAGPDEAIYEITVGDKGGLISVRLGNDGQPIVELYRIDAEIDIRISREEAARA